MENWEKPVTRLRGKLSSTETETETEMEEKDIISYMAHALFRFGERKK